MKMKLNINTKITEKNFNKLEKQNFTNFTSGFSQWKKPAGEETSRSNESGKNQNLNSLMQNIE
jgi:hypothetical protein